MGEPFLKVLGDTEAGVCVGNSGETEIRWGGDEKTSSRLCRPLDHWEYSGSSLEWDGKLQEAFGWDVMIGVKLQRVPQLWSSIRCRETAHGEWETGEEAV